MTTFVLYRLKVEILPLEERTISGDLSQFRRESILEAIEEKPTIESKNAPTWHIGQIDKLSEDAVFFAFGKVTKATRDLYDRGKGIFIEESIEEAPHTHVAVDLKYQVCAIAKTAKITGKMSSIATNLVKLLNASKVTGKKHIIFTLSEIRDPEEFIKLLKNAERITSFAMSFSSPNPFDTERDFQKPMEKLAQATKAKRGKVSINGEYLETETLEELTHSGASSGSEITARIQTKDDERPVLKYLSGNPATIEVDEFSTEDKRRNLFQLVREYYQKIRNKDEES